MSEATASAAWGRVQDSLPTRRAEALRLVLEHPGSTARELEQRSGDPNLHRRIDELASQGLVEPSGAKPCSVTTYVATTWRAVDPDSVKEVRPFERPPSLRKLLEARVAELEAENAALRAELAKRSPQLGLFGGDR